jgi:hypothetical protein
MPPCPKPKNKKKRKKKKKPQWKIDRLKCIALAKKITRNKPINCEKCGKVCIGKGRHAAHVIPVDYGHTAADLRNLLVLCANCHVFSNDACHNSPIHFEQWFSRYRPGLKELLLQEANNSEKVNWPMVYENLLIEAKEWGVKI